MSKYHILISLTASLLLSCTQDNKQAEEPITPDTPQTQVTTQTSPKPIVKPIIVTKDTLQFIQYDDNYDYWYAYFLNSKKDTVRLVTDHDFTTNQIGKLMEVKWKTDTLFEAGEGEKKYTDKRMLAYKVIKGSAFVAPVSEKKVLADINNLEEVKASADRTWIATRPDFKKPYYQVETTVKNEDNNSRLFSFRVYIFPTYEIRVMDNNLENDLSLPEWRSNH